MAKEYVTQYPDEAEIVVLDMYARWPTFLNGLLFVMGNPVASTHFFMFVFRHHAPGLLRYSLHLALRACAKYTLAVRCKKQYVFIDEGMCHILGTIPGHAVGEPDMRKALESLPKSTRIVIAEEGNFHRFHREDVAMHPRIRQGSDMLAKWEIAARQNVATLARLLRESGAQIYTIPSFKIPAEQNIAALRTFVIATL